MVPTISEFYRAARNLIELHLLQALAHCPNDSQSRIAKRAGIGLSVAHVYLHRLNIAGLVEFRGPSDKKLLYTVTETGRQYMEDLQGRHFGALMSFVAEAGHQISLALEQARSDGFRRVGVLGGDGALRAAAGAAQPLGMEVVALHHEDLVHDEKNGDAPELPAAVLVAANPYRSDIAASLTRLSSLGIRCYNAALARTPGDDDISAAAAEKLSRSPLRSTAERREYETRRATW